MNDKFNEIELRRLDLNLLLVFSALMREGSVARAARRLFLGPSAVSMALGRLREALDDQLFVRDRGAMVPTSRARLLWREIAPALETIEAATRSATFEPGTSQAVFTLGAPDDLEFLLIPRLFDRLAAEAPGVRLAVQPMDFRNLVDRLDDGSVDLGLSALPSRGLEARHRTAVLHRERFSALYDPARLDFGKSLSRARFLKTPHVLVSIRGDFSGPVDRTLGELGLSRTIVGSIARFATVPYILRRRPVLACVPATAARHMALEFELAARPLPFQSPEFDLALAWHRRTDRDPAHVWFRQIVEAEVGRLVLIGQPND